jgi:hypothetical protein
MRKTVLVGLLLLDFSNPAASTIFVVPLNGQDTLTSSGATLR